MRHVSIFLRIAGLLLATHYSLLATRLAAQPTVSATNVALVVNKNTGAITGPVSAATFANANGLTGGGGGGGTWGSITGTLASQSDLNTALSLRALIASPTFTGTPAAPTAAADTNTTQLATTAFVIGQSYLKSATAAATYLPLAGNAASATILQTSRTINGVSFNGSQNITVTAAGSTLSDTVPVSKGGTGLTALGTSLQVVRVNSGGTALEYTTLPGGGDALTANTLAQFASTTSSQLAGVVSDETGTGVVVLATSPTLTTPNLGTPSAAVLTNATGLPISTGVSGLGSGVGTFLATPSSSNLATAVTGETGSGALVFATSPALVTPDLGTPSGATLTNATGLPISTGVSGLGSGVATFLGTPSSSNLAAAVTGETGTGALVFGTSPTLTTPALGTPSAVVLTNATGLPIATGVSGLGTGVATALATPSSANLASAITDETGTGAAVFASDPLILTPNSAMGALAVDVTKRVNTKSVSADSPLTFSGTPTTGATFGLTLTNSDTAAHTITIPSSYSLSLGTTRTTFTLPASGKVEISWRYDGTTYFLAGEPAGINDLTTVTPATGDYLPLYDVSGAVDGKATIADIVALATGGSAPTVNAQTGTTYTLVIGDANNFVTMSNASANVLTIPLNATVAFATGTTIIVEQLGAGATTITPTSGATINGSSSSIVMPSQRSWVNLVKVGTNAWESYGGDFIIGNSAIAGATKTKITYDAKGLVTSGADATTADIADSSDKRYVTDAQRTVITNTSGTNTGDQTTVSGNAGTATALAAARAIYGNNFDGTAALTQIIASTYGGTGNGFAKFSGPASSEKTFTLPNASATVLTDNAIVTVAQGGTGAGTLTGYVKGSGTSTMTASATIPFTDLTSVKDVWVIPIGDETTAITTGTAKVTFRAPYAATVTGVRASLTTDSSSGVPEFNIKEGGTTIFSTNLTIDATEKTSVTAATAAVVSDTSLADDALMTIDVVTAGTGAAGAKISIYVTR